MSYVTNVEKVRAVRDLKRIKNLVKNYTVLFFQGQVETTVFSLFLKLIMAKWVPS